ncbi:SAM-dependent methyltransferase [Thermaurantimonas aggregans]|uniref:SAM-dependent methyltransferase n=1 Tax=Thermaurantimonas aggregans TaxID=2173829 RepID=A0A401XIQ4_9FLAO|nr:class I SAM-dependent rRNA methyltransferase [Thermaurantimonas aggregans]MCX8148816.1 class I SAM-dependent rRNA methyltransferase [Thermaurantimonas aggregans]GCD76873.1 SAM-dependent methyltransferase [Thermaurantimonas aggregans]
MKPFLPNYPVVHIKPEKEKIFFQRHPWIFSGALRNIPKSATEGTPVFIADAKGTIRGIGFLSSGSIAVRILSWTTEKLPVEYFIDQKIKAAIHTREQLGFFSSAETDCFRLIFGEGDGLPGLVVDYYAGYCIVQCHHLGMYHARESIYGALQRHLGSRLTAIYDKSADALHDATLENQWAVGEPTKQIIAREYGHKFLIDFQQGQKTGFFIDQRENRKLLSRLCTGKSVLNTFSYTGGFSIYAIATGAREVVSLDISQRAIDLLEKNLEINQLDLSKHTSLATDAFDYLTHLERTFDIIVLDPPAFAKSHRVTHNAVIGYKRLNALAMSKLAPGGLLMTYSCSQNISEELFLNTVTSAAMDTGIDFQILHRLHQPADHPVSIYHPEGRYLKGLVLKKST